MKIVIAFILAFVCIREIVIFFEELEKEEDKLIAKLCVCVFKILITNFLMSIVGIISSQVSLDLVYLNSTMRITNVCSIFLFSAYLYFLIEFYNLGGFDHPMIRPLLMIESMLFIIVFLLQNRRYEAFGLIFFVLSFNFKAELTSFGKEYIFKTINYNETFINGNYSRINTF